LPSPTSSENQPLLSALASDPDLGELVQMYVDEMAGRIATIQDLLSSADWEGLRRFAHQMKGAAGSYGFEPISSVAGVVEDSVRQGVPEDQIRQAVGDLLAMCSRVRAGTGD
jgi:histidine phosphotransfer protein HptB